MLSDGLGCAKQGQVFSYPATALRCLLPVQLSGVVSACIGRNHHHAQYLIVRPCPAGPVSSCVSHYCGMLSREHCRNLNSNWSGPDIVDAAVCDLCSCAARGGLVSYVGVAVPKSLIVCVARLFSSDKLLRFFGLLKLFANTCHHKVNQKEFQMLVKFPILSSCASGILIKSDTVWRCERGWLLAQYHTTTYNSWIPSVLRPQASAAAGTRTTGSRTCTGCPTWNCKRSHQ